MKKFLLTLFFAGVFLLSSRTLALAIEDPFAVPNNQYGIHVLEEGDLEGAAALVNSNGGDWGYATIVIAQNDQNLEKWQRIFTKMSDLHLIPLVRIASKPVGTKWEKLKSEDTDTWLAFLDSLPWPIKNRYIIVGNEPNHASEWDGKVNPSEYANFLKAFSEKAKLSSEDYFILPAGLDASAPNLLGYMSEDTYLKHMLEAQPDLFNYIDGWTSHAYPNPAFSGNEKDTGRGTIRTYEWERQYLKSLGLTKELPIFITETGWIHDMNGRFPILTDTKHLSEKFEYAYKEVWTKDPKIVAITPFLLNYQAFPFETFSWKDKDGKFYDFYYTVQALPKTGGNPKRILKKKPLPKKAPPRLEFASLFLASNLITESTSNNSQFNIFD